MIVSLQPRELRASPALEHQVAFSANEIYIAVRPGLTRAPTVLYQAETGARLGDLSSELASIDFPLTGDFVVASGFHSSTVLGLPDLQLSARLGWRQQDMFDAETHRIQFIQDADLFSMLGSSFLQFWDLHTWLEEYYYVVLPGERHFSAFVRDDRLHSLALRQPSSSTVRD